MSKRHVVIHASTPAPKKVCTTNWAICVLCQRVTREALQCPARSCKAPIGSGYTSLAQHLLQFKAHGHMPMDVDVERLDEGDGLEATMRRHHASWHKTCRLKFNQTQLDRLARRKEEEEIVEAREMETAQEEGANFGMCTRSSVGIPDHKEEICFFCDEPGGTAGLHCACTRDINRKVRKCAIELGDSFLLAKLAPGDMIAIEAKYHSKCLAALYNKARSAKQVCNESDDSHLHGIAFAELVAFMEDFRMEQNVSPVFKLADLAKLYQTRLEELGGSIGGRVHTSRLKHRLLSAFPDIRAYMQGRSVMLTFDDDIGAALKKACDQDSDDDAMHLARAARVVRKEMFDWKFTFSGSFGDHDSVPHSLLALVNMVLEGPNIKHQHRANTKAAVSISQLLIFNSVKHARAAEASATSHALERETPLPLYLAMKIHAVTRKRTLIDTLFHWGICVSYDRLLKVISDISDGVCEQFSIDGVVCPPKLRTGVFSTAAVDNLDHNPTSATATDSFHGTGISIIQHLCHESRGCDRDIMVINPNRSSSTRSVVPLPSKYTNIPPAALKSKVFTAPSVNGPVALHTLNYVEEAKMDELQWFNAVKAALEKEQLNPADWISWSAYHAALQQAEKPAAITALLPLFTDNAHSVAMIKHSMTLVQAAIQHLNPGQTPVLTADQPLFALAKQIQWTWPNTLGENHIVMMLGGLHIEMAVLKVLGEWLDCSGWTAALVLAGITSSGTADSFIKVSHVTKTRHAHQVTAASLHTLLNLAYTEYNASATEAESALSFEQWCQVCAQQSVQFDYWHKTLLLEITMLLFIRSIREGNFQLYMESLTAIVPWMFALDHTHYSRWLSVHIRDMVSLKEKHPAIFAEFCAGKFSVNKTGNKFSAMALDQCHEQNNATVKESGGAIGLLTNPSALRRWMVAGPEIARMVSEFEAKPEAGEHLHHEQRRGVQETFLNEVKCLVPVIENMGNPFLDNSEDLMVLDTRDILDASVGETVRNAEKLGKEQYEEFVDKRLIQGKKPITEVISKNKLALFSRPPVKRLSKQKMQIASLKSDCALFSRLYVACQTRDGDLDKFFTYENQAAPPSLSVGGGLRLGTKADLLQCLALEEKQSVNAPIVDAKLYDGAAVVQMLNPGTAKTFQEYADNVFSSYVSSQLETAQRVDIVWDVYITDSLKSSTREKRGKGKRRHVASSTMIPKNWKDFLRVDENKSELFHFLSQQVVLLPTGEGKVIYATDGTGVLSTIASQELGSLTPCSHEEADTRLFLHALDAVQKGYRKLCVRTVDTDVVVLAISMFHQINAEELWLAFGTSSSFRYIPIHEVVNEMDPRTCMALPVFHSFTGCDTISAFGGRGKKSAWNTWQVYPEVTDAFESLLLMEETSQTAMAALERFVVLLYDRTSDLLQVNDARKQLFTQKSRNLENIPPTYAALKEHVKRASYQACCWNQALVPNPDIPNPADWGWEKDSSGWRPFWTTLSEASDNCYELIHCGCKKGCRGRCKCVKAALKCTALCSCGGDCVTN